MKQGNKLWIWLRFMVYSDTVLPFFFETKGRVILELIHPIHIQKRPTR